MIRSVAPALAALLLLLLPAPATATEASSAEVAELAHDAAFDDNALRRLEAIDRIDGRPIDLRRLLDDAERDEIDDRVRALVQQPPASAVERDPAAERAEAERILDQDRYHPDDIPRPFRRQLEWIAERLEPVGNAADSVFGWISDLLRALAGGTPGGAATLWAVLGAIVVAVVAVQTRQIVERRGRTRAEDTFEWASSRPEDPRELERRAAAARARGDHELAVRLLFRAGLLRLARSRAIPPRRSLTTGEIRRLLDSPDFDRVGRSFDEIAYGRRPATLKDSEEARVSWSEIVQRTAR